MNTLVIYTPYPGTVTAILKQEGLVERLPHLPSLEAIEDLEVDYPDDGISQALELWFALAIGCKLVRGWHLLPSHVAAERQRLRERDAEASRRRYRSPGPP